MSDFEIVIGLVTVVALTLFLYLKHRQRVPAWPSRSDPAKWTGHGIDLSSLKPRLEEIRRHHLQALPPAKSQGFHRALLHLARKVVLHLAYFHDRDSQTDEHGAGG